ncbi:MAG: hypothetical protein WCO44_12510 [Bacteroidota bacterium]
MENEIYYDRIWCMLPPEVKKHLILIYAEYDRACELHKEWPKDFIHAAAVVAEESGELIQAALQHNYEHKPFQNMRAEAVQTGASALRFLINADGYWCWACRKLLHKPDVTPGKRHDEDLGGCGCSVE